MKRPLFRPSQTPDQAHAKMTQTIAMRKAGSKLISLEQYVQHKHFSYLDLAVLKASTDAVALTSAQWDALCRKAGLTKEIVR
jgi:hypothetical protein